MSYRFLPEAEREYLDAIRFYQQRSFGLGEALIVDLERAMALVVESPQRWKRIGDSGIHCIHLRRFPYAVFYRLFRDAPQITAFAHHRKRPGYWLPRLDVMP